ncbi:Uncharacterised protein [Serratia plymuthica]|nr:Uncharacterised protein [Serratia plymuthica]
MQILRPIQACQYISVTHRAHGNEVPTRTLMALFGNTFPKRPVWLNIRKKTWIRSQSN